MTAFKLLTEKRFRLLLAELSVFRTVIHVFSIYLVFPPPHLSWSNLLFCNGTGFGNTQEFIFTSDLLNKQLSTTIALEYRFSSHFVKP